MRAAGLALLATSFWTAASVLIALAMLNFLVFLAAVAVFLLLLWAIADGTTKRPSRSSWLLAAASGVYVWLALWFVGISAYIETHGCATAPGTCSGIGLMWIVAGISAFVYFLLCWAALRARRNVL